LKELPCATIAQGSFFLRSERKSKSWWQTIDHKPLFYEAKPRIGKVGRSWERPPDICFGAGVEAREQAATKVPKQNQFQQRKVFALFPGELDQDLH
jgi:hypothetical protein